MKTAFAEPEIVTRKGKPVSVILPIQASEKMLEQLGDAADIAYLKQARTKPLSFRPFEDSLTERSKSCV
jgi:antitoxin (DNA-binding transcriptional repressor) of toxin-antitoxin stability system